MRGSASYRIIMYIIFIKKKYSLLDYTNISFMEHCFLFAGSATINKCNLIDLGQIGRSNWIIIDESAVGVY